MARSRPQDRRGSRASPGRTWSFLIRRAKHVDSCLASEGITSPEPALGSSARPTRNTCGAPSCPTGTGDGRQSSRVECPHTKPSSPACYGHKFSKSSGRLFNRRASPCPPLRDPRTGAQGRCRCAEATHAEVPLTTSRNRRAISRLLSPVQL